MNPKFPKLQEIHIMIIIV